MGDVSLYFDRYDLGHRATKKGYTEKVLEEKINEVERSRPRTIARLSRDISLPVLTTAGALGTSYFLYKGSQTNPDSANYAALAIAAMAVFLVDYIPDSLIDIDRRIRDIREIPKTAQFYRNMLEALRHYQHKRPT